MRNFWRLLRSRLLAICCIPSVLLSANFSVQTQPNPSSDVWHLTYTLTISGKGKKDPEFGDEFPKITWSINRTYTGSAILFKTAPFFSPGGNYESADYQSVEVTIDDRISIRSEGTFQHDSFQNVTGNTNHGANSPEITKKMVSLHVDPRRKRFSLSLPLKPAGREKKGTTRRQSIIDRSEYGFGGKPTHEVTPVKETRFAVSSLGFPQTDDEKLFVFGEIGFFNDQPLPSKYLTEWEFRSGPMEPKEPVIMGWMETKTNVRINLTFKLSRTPLY